MTARGEDLGAAPGSGSGLLHQLLLARAAAQPDRLAIVSVAGRWTYGELLDAALADAAALRALGLRAGDRVVCELAPSRGAAALVCALSMTGLVYVPVSPETPRARIDEIVARTEARLHVRAAPPAAAAAPAPPGPLPGWLEGERLRAAPVGAGGPAAAERVLDTDLAYLIFTSGTTGRPKGIMMTHGAAATFLRALVEHCGLTPDDRVGSVAPLSFDFSLLDLACALGSGATLVLVPPLLPHHPPAFVDFLLQHGVTQMSGVPSIWRAALAGGLDQLSRLAGRLRHIFYAGEAFSVQDVRRLQAALPAIRIINCFGHSESIACSFRDLEHPLDPDHTRVPFAQAHRGVELLLLDEQQRPVERPGEVGELYLRGPSLFSGYWGDPQATAEALIPHPLRPLGGERVFRSGDLASRAPGGDFYFEGRRDLQVKIGGNRIELEEIERCLAAHPAVDAVCVAKAGSGLDAKLVAFVAAHAAGEGLVAELRPLCARALPRYMMPSVFQLVAELPLTLNGKVDRHALVRRYQEIAAGAPPEPERIVHGSC